MASWKAVRQVSGGGEYIDFELEGSMSVEVDAEAIGESDRRRGFSTSNFGTVDKVLRSWGWRIWVECECECE